MVCCVQLLVRLGVPLCINTAIVGFLGSVPLYWQHVGMILVCCFCWNWFNGLRTISLAAGIHFLFSSPIWVWSGVAPKVVVLGCSVGFVSGYWQLFWFWWADDVCWCSVLVLKTEVNLVGCCWVCWVCSDGVLFCLVLLFFFFLALVGFSPTLDGVLARDWVIILVPT